MLLKLARHSLWNRRTTAILTVIALSLGIALLAGIDHLRHQAKDSFRQTLSGTDLIVGPRGGDTNLLLYSVFQIGYPSNSISPETYQHLADHPMVDWAVPIALGDTVRGFPVFATHWSYFERYRYGHRRNLEFAQGRPFAAASDNETVLGARVAQELGYELGDELVVSHGVGDTSFHHHDYHPLTVVGILEPTGTPADRRVHMSLLAMEALHSDGHDHDHGHHDHEHHDHAEHNHQGHDAHGHHDHDHHHDHSGDHDDHHGHDHERHDGHHDHSDDHHGHHTHDHDHDHGAGGEAVPGEVNAVLLGLRSRPAVFSLQRELNEYRGEPLTALIPGVALTELWRLVSVAENLLYLISFMVLFATLAGMMTMLLASMGERRRELAILRTVGASGLTLFWLIELEVILLTLLSMVAGLVLLTLGLAFAQPWLASQYGLFIAVNPLSTQTAYLLVGILALAALMGLVPALTAYRRALADGLNPYQK